MMSARTDKNFPIKGRVSWMGNASRFRVGGWTVTPGLNLLEHADGSVKIESRPMDVLVCLANRAPETVSVDELVREVWRGRLVTDVSIYRVINQLRNAFGESGPGFIETVPKRGYRLVAPVQFLPERSPSRDRSGIRSVLPERWHQTTALALSVILVLAIAVYVSPWSPLHPGAQLEPPTIAVLPFANLSGDEDDDYLGEGIAEEIIHALSHGSGLRIIAQTSSFSFQGTGADIREIGERLGASIILEGSVRRENGQLRVIAQLIESDTNIHLWSDSFDLPVGDLLTVEREIALAVAQRLMGEEADMARIAAALPPLADIDAYEYYLLGRQRMRVPSGLSRGWPIADANQSVEYFRRAVALDPSFARAYTGLADALLLRTLIRETGSERGEVPRAVAEEALAAIDRAVTLDPELAEARLSRGTAIRVLEQDQERAFTLYREAIALNPNLVMAHYHLARGVQGEEGIAALKTAVQLDPMSGELHLWLGRILSDPDLGRQEEAAPYFEQAISLGAVSTRMLIRTANNRTFLGRPDEAIRLLQPLVDDPDFQHDQRWVRAVIASFYLDLNSYRMAEELLSASDEPTDSINTRIHLALAQGQYQVVSDLIQTWQTLKQSDSLALIALYEMIIGLDDRARERYEAITSERDLLFINTNFQWGYYPAVNAAHLFLRAGKPESAAVMLEESRRALYPALEDRYKAGGAYYLLASIFAIEGNANEALAMLEQAISRGWTRHWYAPLDPNLERLWDEPRFQVLIADLRSEMDRLRLEMQPLVALD